MSRAPHARLISLVLAGLWLPLPATAQVDVLELRLSRQLAVPLRWLAAEAAGEPRENLAGDALRLAPGESLSVLVPAGEALRVHRAEPSLTPGDLAFELSDGSGLFLASAPRSTADGRDLFLETPPDGAHVVRLSRPASAAGALGARLFVGQHSPRGPLAPYREELELPGPTLELSSGRHGEPREVNRLAAGEALTLELSGPARLKLEGRVHFPPGESESALRWRLTVLADRRVVAQWSLGTAAQAQRPIFLDGQPAVVGRVHEFSFNLPEGARELRLESDQPALLRLLRLDPQDVLLPALNAPRPEPRELLDEGLALKLERNWSASLGESDALLEDPGAGPAERVMAAARLAADNRRREGGLRGAVALERLAAERRDTSELAREAAQAYAQASFYRELLPERFAPGSAPRSAWMLHPRPASGPRREGARSVASQHAGALVAGMARGRFLPLADATPLEYVLEERFSPSWLELAAHTAAGHPARLWLQFDDEPARALNLDPALPPGLDYETGAGEAALALLRRAHGEAGGTTLDAAFARHAEPAPLIRAGILRIPLARDVSRIRVWRDEGGATPWVALRYRASRAFRLPEQAWRESAAALGTGALQASLRAAFEEAGGQGEAPRLRELDSHWQALARAVRSAAARFGASVSEPVGAQPLADPARLAAARAAGVGGDWPAVLEAIAQRGGAPALRLRALALEQLGESYLAERQLRQALLFDADTEAREAALDLLDARYRQAGDSAARRNLHSAAWLAQPDAPRSLALAQALLDDQEPGLALQLALSLAPGQRPLELVLEASLAERWWASFDEALAMLPPAARPLWAGLRALAEGDEAGAEGAWGGGADEAGPWLAQLRAARALRERLASPAADRGALAGEVAQWFAWHPGPRRWVEDERVFAAAEGAARLYSIDRDLHFDAFRASAARPARIRVLGPLRLRIEARPLHPGGDGGALEGWLVLRSGGHSWREPILSNWPSEGLRVAGAPAQRVGQAVRRELTLGPGWHELEVDGGRLPLLLRAEIERPSLALPLLALPSWSTAAITGRAMRFRENEAGDDACAGCLWVTDQGGGGRAPALAALVLERDALRDNPQSLAEEHFAALREARPGMLSSPANEPREQLLALLWAAGQAPRRDPALLAEAEELVLRHPDIEGAAAILQRLREGSDWRPFDNVAGSAGLRAVEVGGQPESPTLRNRQALLAPLAGDERRLSGESRLVLFIDQPGASRAGLSLEGESLPGLAREPLQVGVQLDERAPQRLSLMPGERRSLDQHLPAGRHALRVWVDEPAVGHSLRVGVEGPLAQALRDDGERLFHVARRDEPLRASIPGPAWVRIDEWREGQLTSDYRHVRGEWGELELHPAAGREEGLFRLQVRELVADLPRPPSPPRQSEPRPVPAPPPLAERPAPARVVLRDGLALGGQGPGTWSLGLARVRSLDAEGAGQGLARYLEASASHRHFDEREERFLRTELLARRHAEGSPSLGAGVDWLRQRGERPYELRLAGSLFAQPPRTGGGLAWAAQARAELALPRRLDGKTRHRPRVALFARHQSLNGEPGAEALVEREVYTRYRDQHPWGLSIGDTLSHRPWLDSEAWLSASATSNADFDPLQPDHLRMGAGWRQLAGPLVGELALSGTHYLRDGDRSRATTTGELAMELRWEHWGDALARHELGLRYEQRLDDGLWGLGLVWQMHFGGGRGYADFRGSETPFRELREWRQPAGANHFIEEPPQ